jgi:hypothetical protein
MGHEYDICVSDRKTYMHVRVNEPVTLQVLNGFMHETAEKANEYEIDNFLFDLRQAPNRTSVFALYEFAYNQSKRLGFKPLSKHVLLISLEDMVDYHFVETILINAGYQGKIFTDESAAIEWLEK